MRVEGIASPWHQNYEIGKEEIYESKGICVCYTIYYDILSAKLYIES